MCQIANCVPENVISVSLCEIQAYILILPPGLDLGYDDLLSIVYHLLAWAYCTIIINHLKMTYYCTFVDLSLPQTCIELVILMIFHNLPKMPQSSTPFF